jgi:hypothetical protein
MSRLTAAQKTALSSSEIRTAWLLQLAFDSTTYRLNSTSKDLAHNSETYLGRGYVASVSGVQEGVELRPQQFNVSISGIDRSLLADMLSGDYLNRLASVSIAVIDADGLVASTIPVLSGAMTDLGVVYGDSISIKITIEDRLALWNRARTIRYTRAQQEKRNPNDDGFNFVESIDGVEIVWPTAEWLEVTA